MDDKKSLTQRYLFWLYKTTRDEVDKIDRKFTQLDVDKKIQRILEKKARSLKVLSRKGISVFLEEWKEYIFSKESDAQKLKFNEEGEVNYRYLFLCVKLEAVTRVIKDSFGSAVLKRFKALYEEAAFKAILEDNSGRR